MHGRDSWYGSNPCSEMHLSPGQLKKMARLSNVAADAATSDLSADSLRFVLSCISMEIDDIAEGN